MPELPDLTVVAEELERRIAGRTVAEASAPTPILVRATPEELTALAEPPERYWRERAGLSWS